ncbi:hypothetical protein NX871_30700, partial [Burkholderia thailandensis]|nr:hypothetical protein [Burkholderia thailandensis]
MHELLVAYFFLFKPKTASEVALRLVGPDETTGQVMQARHAWEHDDIRWHHRYVDLMSDVDGMTHIDYTRFNDTEPVEPPGAAPDAQAFAAKPGEGDARPV